ncbi:ATPase [Methanocaldococcus sp. FS406-22]|uniref:ATP-binding protein n=1 Tax=Methanocaldococcus sp. (strain FS406-22) TaxID=644281 RepID=UPI0001BF2480|nr:ATP-binding protein [Methanocaldococcus sp. FS406-22]ADC70019.1 ATPase [Methanocaldococcus sp. FS406-22]
MRFFDREKEIKEILYIIEREPQRINFIYGPINSGKTALINEIISNRLDKNKYVVFYIDLRGHFLSKYDDFVRVLFNTYSPKKSLFGRLREYIKSLINDSPNSVDIPILPTLTYGVLTGIPIPKNLLNQLLKDKNSDDVFEYLTEVFESINKEGKKPILIIDELQKIGDMKINGYLIYELFNYFVSLTKHKHLCHILCLSSDSLFIEKVYNEAMLEGRCKYLLVDDFDKETSLKFIDFLLEENDIKLSNEDKELIYSYVGGKPMDIKYVIEECKFKDLKEILDYMLKDATQKLDMFLDMLNYSKPKVEIGDEVIEIKKEDVIEALRLFKKNYELDKKDIPVPVYIYLVKKNILFLDPINGILKPQSFLVWNAIKRLL